MPLIGVSGLTGETPLPLIGVSGLTGETPVPLIGVSGLTGETPVPLIGVSGLTGETPVPLIGVSDGRAIAMRDIKTPWVLWMKAVLFAVLGVLAAVLILMELPSVRMAAVLCLCVWAFCRAYYFTFYVIERHIDPSFRFAGLSSVAAYLLRRGGT